MCVRRKHEVLGRAVKVDPMKPMLKPPRTKHLKLKCDVLLSTFALKFNMRHCSWTDGGTYDPCTHISSNVLTNSVVGRCGLTLSNTY